MNDLILIPALGRDYGSASNVLEAFNSGLDFKVLNGAYANKADCQRLGIKKVWIRYNKLQNKIGIQIV